jgi:hypothetical protein
VVEVSLFYQNKNKKQKCTNPDTWSTGRKKDKAYFKNINCIINNADIHINLIIIVHETSLEFILKQTH